MRLLLALIALCMCTAMDAQTLSGTVTDENGDPLPFAAIYIPDRKGGTATNVNGQYSISLPARRFTVVYQYLGYAAQEIQVDMTKGDVALDVSLEPEPVELENVTVAADREDPAYTIMRKAIAKAKYHTQQIDSSKFTVYIKGSGRLKGLPGLFRKRIENELAKEGIDTTTAFTTESVSEITYVRPNTYKEKVISVRTIGDDRGSSPSGFIKGSFYEPEVNGSVSPLSPKAFAYYRFEYLGEFTARGHLINKIKVTPRSRGDNVFEGTIYIVDQLWSIHSLDLFTYIWGIKFNINQVYQPVLENVWLPLNNIFDVTGQFFGFKFEFQYFANSSDYQITLNPDLEMTFDIIDDKLYKEEAKQADAELASDKTTEAIEKLSNGEEVSRKELRKILKEYEKQERREFEQDTMVDVVSITEFNIDSMAYERDSVYWEKIRPVPLTQYESKGYRVQDSIAQVEAKEREAADDSVSVTLGTGGVSSTARSKSEFEPMDIIMGGTYNVGSNLRFTHVSPLLFTSFNTVDGYHTGLKFVLANRSKGIRWEISPHGRYAFSREAFNYSLTAEVSGGPRFRKWAIVAEGGNMTAQINRDNPIEMRVNSVWSQMLELNFMKIYERDFAFLGFQKDFSHKLRAEVEGEWSRNRMLSNTTNFKFFNNRDRSYTSNTPFNAEIGDTGFEDYQASTFSLLFRYKPWARYRIRNGRRSIIDEPSPTFTISGKYAVPNLFGSDVNYSQLEIGFTHVVSFPAGSILNINATAGIFTHGDPEFFPEFRHFLGSRIPLSTLDPVGRFRSLEYYTYSTADKYAAVHLYYQFRKLLATQLLEVRMTGAREGFFLSVLETPSSEHYFEVGYSLNYIFRILRIEVVSNFSDFRYVSTGVRVGIAANLETLFN